MQPKRISQFRGDILDELVAECDSVTIRRAGVARYEIELRTPTGVGVIRLWTTAKARIAALLDLSIDEREESSPPTDWSAEYDEGERVLGSLHASRCTVHLEHLDRGHYYVGLARASGESWRIHFSAPGYLKAKLETAAA